MKSKLPIFAFLYLFFYKVTLTAYDHVIAAPTMASRHGGQVVSSDAVNSHFEMVQAKNIFKLFVYPMGLKRLDSKNFKFKVILHKNGAKTQESATIVFKDDFYEIQSAHRNGFRIYLKVTNTNTQKEDVLRFVY